jgi:hypothetical protein
MSRYGYGYGSQVFSSGDLVVRDALSSSQSRIDFSQSINSKFISFDAEVPEVSREVYSHDSESLCGRYSTSCLRSDDTYKIMEVTVETDPEKTIFSSGYTQATLSQGLSFNSDESAIYFGKSKTFRVMFSSDSPKRLVFQYLDPGSSEYVTKFSCAKS